MSVNDNREILIDFREVGQAALELLGWGDDTRIRARIRNGWIEGRLSIAVHYPSTSLRVVDQNGVAIPLARMGNSGEWAAVEGLTCVGVRGCAESTNDATNPSHYKNALPGDLEVWDVMVHKGLAESAAHANLIKYVMRFENKNGIEDLKKAQWYLEKLIEIRTAKEKK